MRARATRSRPCRPATESSRSPRSTACSSKILDEERLQPEPRVRGGEGLLGDLHDGVHAVVEERVDQLFLVAEPPVDGADADARVVGDVVERDLEATRREDLAGGREDALAVAGGIAAERALVAQGLTCVAGHKARVALNGGHLSVSCATLGLEVEITSPLGELLST